MSNILEDNEKLVNGPVNAIRLEGKVGHVNKVIYLFGDYHYPLGIETKCDSFVSEDFVTYFYKTMKKSNKNIKYDFIFENFYDIPMFEQYKYTQYKSREKYINEMRKYVDDDMNIYEKNITNKSVIENRGSKRFSNLRLHYLDVRFFFGAELSSENLYLIDKELNNYNGYNSVQYMLGDFINLKNTLIWLSNKLNYILYNKEPIEYFKEKKLNILQLNEYVNRYFDKLNEKNKDAKKYLEKIFLKYSNSEINEKIIKSHIVSSIFNFIKKINEKIDICIDKMYELEKLQIFSPEDFNINASASYGPDYVTIYKIINNIKSIMMDINNIESDIYVNITDLYLLRRILDKNYITNAIVYSGMAHSNYYAYTLVKEFDFKITHVDFSRYSVEETNKFIKKVDFDEFSKNILYKPKFKQCVNMSLFPDGFE